MASKTNIDSMTRRSRGKGTTGAMDGTLDVTCSRDYLGGFFGP